VLPLEQKPLAADLLKKQKPDSGGGEFGARLHAALERSLAQQGGLKVVPVAAVKFGESHQEVARRLKVRLVLRGQIEFPGENKLVARLELLDAEAGTLAWSEVYSEPANYEWPAATFQLVGEKLARDVTERLPLRQLRGERALNYVAVLPYLPLPPDTVNPGAKNIAQLNGICDLVTRNLATALSRDRRLKVVSPNSIARLKATDQAAGPEAAWSEARRTGKRLGVDVVLEVTCRAEQKGTVPYWYLYAELVEVESGAVLWVDIFESPVGAPVGLGWPDTVPASLPPRVAALVVGK
jgi:TolB-like protein